MTAWAVLDRALRGHARCLTVLLVGVVLLPAWTARGQLGPVQPGLVREPAVLEVPAPPNDPARPPRRIPGVEKLAEKYQGWLQEVDVLITDPEIAAFLALGEDYERDAFIREFWRVRDADPATARNEFRERFEARIAEARGLFPSLVDLRSRVLLALGPADERFEISCGGVLWPTEAWFYRAPEGYRYPVALLFFRKWGVGHWRLWDGHEGAAAFYRDDSVGGSTVGCNFEPFQLALKLIQKLDSNYLAFLHDLEVPRKRRQNEWVETFASYSTKVPAGASAQPAELELKFPGWHGRRTVVEAELALPRAGAAEQQVLGFTSYNFVLNGEVLLGEELFERFRYRFDVPASEAAETIRLPFQRFLRAEMEVTLRLRLEDLGSGGFFTAERHFTVPRLTSAAPSARPVDAESARLQAAAEQALASGETTLKLVRPLGDLLTGMTRFDALVLGEDVRKVAFMLEGEPALTKSQPPFSIELDLGPLPRPRTLTAVAFDGLGEELARDDLTLNSGGHRFAVRLSEPRRGASPGRLRAVAHVDVPDGEQLEQVELFLGERRVATLYAPPWVQPLPAAPAGEPSFVRAVATLVGGGMAEDLVWVNAPPGYGEEVEIDLVELYASVVDRDQHLVTTLTAEDFTVSEDGRPQTLARFEAVGDLPVQVGVLLDISASMAPRLATAKEAVVGFLERLTEPRDRLALIPFNDRPYLATKLTRSAPAVGEALAGLRAERGTALFDSLIFGLFYFNGLGGQRAMLVISDGEDESSRFRFEDALEMARRSGVTLYTIGLDLGDSAAARQLARLAEETGGRAFNLPSANELPRVAEAILVELRARYLLVYQSTQTAREDHFRTITVKVAKRGLEVRAPQGYYP